MALGKKPRQFVMLVVPLVLMMDGCSAAGLRATATQEQPTSTASPISSVAVTPAQDWVARHQEEDRVWADRTGLIPEQVRQLRLMADVPDDEAAYIVNLDTENLKTRNHILLVTAGGNGHCLELVVLERKGDGFQRMWSVAGTPGGAGFCRESPTNPEAYATTNGEIVIKIPVFDYNKGTGKATDLYTYVWNGKSYEFTASKSGA